MASAISANELRAHMRSNFHFSGCRPAPEINIRERLTPRCTSAFISACDAALDCSCDSARGGGISARAAPQSARPTLRLTKSRIAGQPLALEHRSDACTVCRRAYPRTARDRELPRQYKILYRPKSAMHDKLTASTASAAHKTSDVCPVKAPITTTEEWLDSLRPTVNFDKYSTLEPWEVSDWDTELLSDIVQSATECQFCR